MCSDHDKLNLDSIYLYVHSRFWKLYVPRMLFFIALAALCVFIKTSGLRLIIEQSVTQTSEFQSPFPKSNEKSHNYRVYGRIVENELCAKLFVLWLMENVVISCSDWLFCSRPYDLFIAVFLHVRESVLMWGWFFSAIMPHFSPLIFKRLKSTASLSACRFIRVGVKQEDSEGMKSLGGKRLLFIPNKMKLRQTVWLILIGTPGTYGVDLFTK